MASRPPGHDENLSIDAAAAAAAAAAAGLHARESLSRTRLDIECEADICPPVQTPPWLKKGKVFPYSLPSVGPGADPGVQAVSPQVT